MVFVVFQSGLRGQKFKTMDLEKKKLFEALTLLVDTILIKYPFGSLDLDVEKALTNAIKVVQSMDEFEIQGSTKNELN